MAQEWIATVVSNRHRGGGLWVLRLRVPLKFPSVRAGAFVMLSVGSEPEILLRRPMAIYDLKKARSATWLDILYGEVGRGTRQLATLGEGHVLSLLAPIGNAFSTATHSRTAIVAGGVGIAPFLLWGRQQTRKALKNATFFLGFRDRTQLRVADDFHKAGVKVKTAVEGLGGDFRGTVVDLFLAEIDLVAPQRILTCGPERMMERVVDIARQRKVPCEISLEARMACGVGVCLSCVTSFVPGTRPGGYALVCQDGPVFEAQIIDVPRTYR